LSAHRAIASSILFATAFIKAVGLASGPKWIHQPDVLFQAPNWAVISSAIAVEIGIGVSLFWSGRLPILALRTLTVIFAAYHTLRILIGFQAPCSCLGRLSDWSPFFRDHGDGITLLILLCLAWLSSFSPGGTMPLSLSAVSSRASPPSLRCTPIALVLSSVFLWAAIGAVAIFNASGIRLGGDEGIELSKLALMQSQGGIPSAWNDQNWLFTLLLRCVASIHPGIDFLRAFCFSLTLPIPLVAALLCVRHGRPWASLLFPLLLFGQAGAVVLIPSVMMEAPAVGVGTAAAIPFLLSGPATSIRCWTSGLLAAVALSLKPTAAFALVPVLVLAFQSRTLTRFFISSTLAGLGFVCCSIFLGLVQPLVFAQSHSAHPPHPMAWDAWGASGAGLLLICAVIGLWFRGSAIWAFGLAFAVLVLSLHQPAWSYYHIHFWVPAAGLFVTALRSKICAVVFGVISIVLISHQLHLVRSLAASNGGPESAWIPAIRAARPASMFSSESALYYLTGVSPHPDYAVLPLKRTWAGYSSSHISNDIVRIRPQVLVLSGDYVGQIGTNGYALIDRLGTSMLLALPELRMIPQPPQPSILKRMGL